VRGKCRPQTGQAFFNMSTLPAYPLYELQIPLTDCGSKPVPTIDNVDGVTMPA
jgi:hypothetical protein